MVAYNLFEMASLIIYATSYMTLHNYGDIIPNIMSNAIMTNLLLIIEHEGSCSLQLIKCIEEYRHTVLLYKRGAHYDAILPVNAS